MQKAFSYYRVSTDEQAQHGKSIDTQRSLCKKWASDNDYDIVQEFVDEGKSATKISGRKALQDLLERCSDGGVDAIIVQDTDRLARNTYDHLTIKSLLKKQGVVVISTSQPMIDDSPEGNMIDSIIASVNTFQSALTGRKTSKVLSEKASLGWFPKIPPLGYINSENPNPTGNLDKKIISLDESISPYITSMFEQYATGNYSLMEMAEYLNKSNVKPNRGLKLHKNTINNILRNEFYVGYFTWNSKRYKGKHPALVKQEVFDRVQIVMQNHNRNISRKRTHNFLLSGFLFSKKDGKRMLGEKHKKPNGRVYSFYCNQNDRADSYVDSEKIEKGVEEIFQKIQISKEYSDMVIATAKTILTDSRKSQSTEKKRISGELQKIEKAIQEVEDSRFLSGKIGNEMFQNLYTRYNQDRDRLTEELVSLNRDDSKNIEILEKILKLAENLGKAYKEADNVLKKTYLNMFIKKIWVSNKKIVGFDLTDEVKDLIEDGLVQLSSDWGG